MPWKKTVILIGAVLILVGVVLSAVEHGLQANIQKDLADLNREYSDAVFPHVDNVKFEEIIDERHDLEKNQGMLMLLNAVFTSIIGIGLFMVILGFLYLALDIRIALSNDEQETD